MSPSTRIAGRARFRRKIDRLPPRRARTLHDKAGIQGPSAGSALSRGTNGAGALANLMLRFRATPLPHHACQNGLLTSRHRSVDASPISRNSMSLRVARNARSLILASHCASIAAHRFRNADAKRLLALVFTQPAVFAAESRGDSSRRSDAARVTFADAMVLAPTLCE